MALYYFDRYQYTETTTWSWKKGSVQEVRVYAESDGWHNLVNLGYHPSYTGSPNYRFTTSVTHGENPMREGGFQPYGTPITIYPSGSNENGPYVYGYPLGGATDVVERYYLKNSQLHKEMKYSHYVSSYYELWRWIDTLYGLGYSAYQHKQVNPDGFWYERGASQTTYAKGTYVDTIKAEQSTFPANGKSGNYWYVKGKRAFPELKIRQAGQLKSSADGWVRVNGQLKQIQQIWVRVNGQLKEV